MYSLFLSFAALIKLCGAFNIAVKCCPVGQELQPNHYKCSNSTTLEHRTFSNAISELNYALLSNETRFPKCQPHEAYITRSLDSFKEKQHLLHKFSDICFDTSNSINMLIGCIGQRNLEGIPQRKLTMKKCCPFGQKPVPRPRNCIESDEAFEPVVYDISDLMTPVVTFATEYDIISPGCLEKGLYDETYLLSNGSVYFPNTTQVIFEQEESCVDTVYGQFFVFICYSDQDAIEDTENVHFIAGVGLVISLSFLAATFILYASDKKKRHFYGQTVMCHVASFFVAFLFLARSKFASVQGVFCEITAYVMYGSFIAGFLWQNVMCIDLWRTFRSIRSRDVLGNRKKTLRFIGYSVYAWGCTAILTIILITGEKRHWLPDILTPKVKDCWLERTNYAYFIFFIGPIACVIVVNTILYIFTARRCYQVKSEIAKRLKKIDAKQKNTFFRNKEQLSLSAKLFVVMGVSWSFEVISFMLKAYVPRWVFYISDALNTLYGLQIFIIFVLRKKVFQVSSRMSWISLQQLFLQPFN